jgi:hypothetical protein
VIALLITAVLVDVAVTAALYYLHRDIRRRHQENEATLERIEQCRVYLLFQRSQFASRYQVSSGQQKDFRQ